MDKTSNFIQFLSYYLLFVKLKVILCGEAETSLKIKLGLKHLPPILSLFLSLCIALVFLGTICKRATLSQGNK